MRVGVIDDQANDLRFTSLMDYCIASAYRCSRLRLELDFPH